MAPNVLSKARAEILAELQVHDDLLQATWQRIRCALLTSPNSFGVLIRSYRIISSFQSDSQSIFELTPLAIEAYETVYKTLLRAEPVACAATGVKYDAVCAPNVVILSVSQRYLAKLTRIFIKTFISTSTFHIGRCYQREPSLDTMYQ